MSILSINGYGVVKKDNKVLISELQEELTMNPVVNFSMTSASEQKSFKIYTENDKRLYVPRYYGLQKFGLPDKCTLTEGIQCNNMIFNGTLREQQLEPVNNFIKAASDPLKRGGIISVPCGFGKTIMSVYIACHFQKKTMFVSHKDFLNQQFVDTVKQFVPKAKIGIIKQRKVDVEGKDFVVASLQSLAMRDYDINIFKDFGLVIIDEVHHLGAEVFCRAFQKLNVSKILGLSATLNRKDGMRKVFEYYIGKSVYKLVKKDEVDVKVEIHKYFDPNVEYSRNLLLWNGKPNNTGMISNICSFSPRNNYIIDILKRVLKEEPDRKILILSERRNQLSTLEELIEVFNISDEVGYYVGGMAQKYLDESAKKNIIMATYQMAAEGMNIPSLNTVIFASPISDIQQSIGRILREKPSERKYIPLVIDIWDEFSIFTRKGYTRIKYYKNNNYTMHNFIDNCFVEPKKETNVKYKFIDEQ